MADHLEIPDRDPVREYTRAEEQQLTRQLLALSRGIHGGRFQGVPIDHELLCTLHRSLFDGVRDFAGRMRCRDFGAEYLNFGPNRSTRKHDVPAELRTALEHLRHGMKALLSAQEAPDYEAAAIHWAVWAHAEVIRIHPFEDGNGRTSRLLMAHVLVELGLSPIPIEAVREEYERTLNNYYQRGDITPLKDLFLRLADSQL